MLHRLCEISPPHSRTQVSLFGVERKKKCRLRFVLIGGFRGWKDLTFATFCVPLSAEETRLLFRSTMRSDGGGKELSAVVQRIGDALQECGPQGAFVKLHTRSPKDAVSSISNTALLKMVEVWRT